LVLSEIEVTYGGHNTHDNMYIDMTANTILPQATQLQHSYASITNKISSQYIIH